ncbi:unnamed protein product, partial [Rotaria sp. Silwood2]
RVKSQLCRGISQYGKCSSNSACGCFLMPGATDTGICGFQWPECSEIATRESSENVCRAPDHICVNHPRCHNRPVCYPVSMMGRQICPSTARKENKR